MGGPSAHGQRNKAHKAGRHAGRSARDKHRDKKEAGGGQRPAVKASGHAGKAERAAAAKQQRDAKRAEQLDARRRNSAPVLVALLPLSGEARPGELWQAMLSAAGAGDAGDGAGSMPTLLAHGRRRTRLTLLPPPPDREDPLAVVELAKAAEVLLLLIPGGEGATPVDGAGAAALALLRALGLPSVLAVVQSSNTAPQKQQRQQQSLLTDDSAAHAMHIDDEEAKPDGTLLPLQASGVCKTTPEEQRQRAAARKRAEKALEQHLPGDVRLLAGDGAADAAALLRTLADAAPTLPVWRRARPCIVVQGATFVPDCGNGMAQQQQEQQQGELRLTGYVRAGGLSANQLVTVPGAGDFQIARIEAAPEPQCIGGTAAASGGGARSRGSAAAAAGDAMDAEDATAGAAGVVLALPDPQQQEPLARENEPDPLAGEQTWPTEEELAEADAAAAAAAASGGAALRRRRLPAGTSEYQAAWILDENDDASDDDDSDDHGDGTAARGAGSIGRGNTHQGDNKGVLDGSDAGAAATAAMDADDTLSNGGADSDGGQYGGDAPSGSAVMMAEDEEAEHAAALRLQSELKAKRAAAAEEDAEFPDEVEPPAGVPARIRFAKYRALKSFRSSPWDAREGLPPEYGRVFAFENPKRAAKRAAEAAARARDGSDPCAVPLGSHVTVVLRAVPAAAAATVLARVTASAAGGWQLLHDGSGGVNSNTAAPPLTVHGLLQHEGKLSVLNFSMRSVQGYDAPLSSSEPLLFVTGLRSFTGRPLLSEDGQGGADKHKLLRYLQPGGAAVGSVYAPISYPPLPLLAFKVLPDARPVLAAAGALRSVDPDRLVIKRAVLTGVPVRVHKARATVRLMFQHPDDVRWFKPAELWTRAGRRGRITEPLGTHGAFKARFDGALSQRDPICIALYKRAFPKWPAGGGVGTRADAAAAAAAEGAAGAGQRRAWGQSGGGGPPPALGMGSFV